MSLLLMAALGLVACKQTETRSPSADDTAPLTDDTASGSEGEDPDDTGGPCEQVPWYFDDDGDGYGHESTLLMACEQPPGAVAVAGDCAPDDPEIHPDAVEICDGGVDNDCDGLADDQDDSLDPSTARLHYPDRDRDGFGDSGEEGILACEAPDRTALDATDCDDSRADVNPGESEVCNDGLDNDCSGDAPECEFSGTYRVDASDLELKGLSSDDAFGDSVVMLDADGSGWEAIAVSAPDAVGGDGAVALFDGPSGSTRAASADWDQEGDHRDMAFGTSLAVIPGGGSSGADALVVGSHDSVAVFPYVSIFEGGRSGLGSSADVDILDTSGEDSFGDGVAGLGDLRGAGGQALAIGAPSDSTVYIFHQAPTSDTYASSADLLVTGDSLDRLGHAQGMAAGDLDGDGYADLVLNSYWDGFSVFIGRLPSSGSLELSDADSTVSSDSGLGWAPTVGDLDGDGYDDLVVGDPIWAPTSGSDRGAVYLYSGGSGTWSGEMDSGDASVVIKGQSDEGYFGVATAVGDANGDGQVDLLASYGQDKGGAVLFYGPLTADTKTGAADATLKGTADGACGHGALLLADVDHDGNVDMGVGCSGVDESGLTGAVHLFLGQSM